MKTLDDIYMICEHYRLNGLTEEAVVFFRPLLFSGDGEHDGCNLPPDVSAGDQMDIDNKGNGNYQVHSEVPENGTVFEGTRHKSPSGCELTDFQLREWYKTLQMDIVNNERLVTVCLNTSNEPLHETITKQPLPTWQLVLTCCKDSNEILKLNKLLYLRVKVEKFDERPLATHCFHCNYCHHSSSNSGYKSRCLKCVGEHYLYGCTPKTEKINQPTCISCGATPQLAVSEGAQDSLSPVLTLLRVIV
ncbi:hypothetical protein CEXT_804791 [Caerostris extrusa]|uniref:Uncharacterized protein n=1 Tax=Caerostris extrusa TaxID=172846 RepID=A0AAV4R8I0_CAEEX|nr:hypothetical protein CEXT_804791 [Caerostris extrusa]